jgi:transcriptional regulator with GAF, ATPase, and Fis domain
MPRTNALDLDREVGRPVGADPDSRARFCRRSTDIIVGSSPAIRGVLDLVAVASNNDITVLVQGESGTGKELVARAIHYTGTRAAHPFITVNCGAVPETLMEDELFGHVRGAFTGAHGEKKGVFEESAGGTLFLDEIGDLYPSCQVKLTRVLQEREVRRLGDTRMRRVDVRVIAATNKDLRREVEQKRFREDLFHRVNVLPISVPPLRERREDIPLLVDHFVQAFNRELGRSIKGLSPAALEYLMACSWPGNVRELDNRVKQAMVMTKGEWVDVDELSAGPSTQVDEQLPTFRQAKAEFEKSYVVRALQISHGKVAAAARMAGKDRKDFYELMKKHAIDPNDFRARPRPA